jgi:hypothetical protein
MRKTMKDRIVSVRAALNGTPKLAARTSAPRRVAKVPPAVVYNWSRRMLRVDVDPASIATSNRKRKRAVESSGVITFTYH